MIPATFDYERAESVEHALQLLGEREDSKLLAGGHSLLPAMKLRIARPSRLVDIGGLAELDYVRDAGDRIAIGAVTRHKDVRDAPLLREHCPIVSFTAGQVGDPQVRHRGTIGGSISHSDPASDLPTVLFALDAEMVVRGPGGERTIPASRFYKSLFLTELKQDEILTEVRIPLPPAKSGGAYRKLKRKTGDFAAIAVAVQLTLGKGGAVERIGIGLTSAGPTPLQAVNAEKALTGNSPSEKALADAARLVSEACSPSADRRGSVQYKKEMARVLAGRALRSALERAGRS